MQFSSVFVIIYCVGVALAVLVKHALQAVEYVFRKKHGCDIPDELRAYITVDDIEKTCAYKDAHYASWIPENLVTTATSVALLFSGFYVWLFTWLWSATANVYATTLLFALFASIPESLVSLPFALYEEFVIEKRFGFSTMTFKLWLADALKSFVINAVVASFLLVVMTLLFEHVRIWWWLLATVYVAFSLLMSFLYPRVIAPLFNKFTPLEDGALKTRVSDFMTRTGFTASGIFVMDASKRSTHSNAYFTGFGKSKRVVLYDTLVNQLTVDELGAVLAHELGHYKKKHLIKQFCVVIPLVYAALFAISKIVDYEPLYKAFGFATDAAVFPHMKFIGLFLISQVFGNFGIFASAAGNYFSRKHEYEADTYAKELCGSGEPLSSALIKLNKENNSEVRVAKLYSAFTYSHPTLLERLDALHR